MLKMWVFSRKIFWQWIEVILRPLQLLEENRLEEGWKRGCKELSLDATRVAGPEGKKWTNLKIKLARPLSPLNSHELLGLLKLHMLMFRLTLPQ